jgi:hypothetical protein
VERLHRPTGLRRWILSAGQLGDAGFARLLIA